MDVESAGGHRNMSLTGKTAGQTRALTTMVQAGPRTVARLPLRWERSSECTCCDHPIMDRSCWPMPKPSGSIASEARNQVDCARLAGAAKAQSMANDGNLVVIVYESPDAHKPGHIAIVRPDARSLRLLEENGPSITQSRATGITRGHPPRLASSTILAPGRAAFTTPCIRYGFSIAHLYALPRVEAMQGYRPAE